MIPSPLGLGARCLLCYTMLDDGHIYRGIQYTFRYHHHRKFEGDPWSYFAFGGSVILSQPSRIDEE